MAILANAGEGGGSMICTSLLIVLFKFEAHFAVAPTQCFIVADTTMAIALKFKDRHPLKDRPLIYYDAVMQINPPL